TIYCGLVNEIIDEINLHSYWIGMQSILPILSEIAQDYIWLPVSSCNVERSFSMYNNLLNNDRQSLSLDSLKQLSMLYFNGN
ncbi:31793_t:CDS:1, partial [Racocetra persica]